MSALSPDHDVSTGRIAINFSASLVQVMQDSSYNNKLLIIFAGYELEMDALLRTDPGLDRRLAVRVVFKDLTAAQAVASLQAYMKKEGGKDGAFRASPDALKLLHALFDDLIRRQQWSNRADIKVVFDMLMNEVDESFDGREVAPMRPAAGTGGAAGGAGGAGRFTATGGAAAAAVVPSASSQSTAGVDMRMRWFKDKSFEAYRTFSSDHVQQVSMSHAVFFWNVWHLLSSYCFV